MYRVIINNAVKIDLDFEKEWTFGEIFKCYNLATDVTEKNFVAVHKLWNNRFVDNVGKLINATIIDINDVEEMRLESDDGIHIDLLALIRLIMTMYTKSEISEYGDNMYVREIYKNEKDNLYVKCKIKMRKGIPDGEVSLKFTNRPKV